MYRAAVIALIAGSSLALTASAQAGPEKPAFDAPRTVHGRPDMQGYWVSRWLTPLERMPGIESLVVSPEKAREIADGILERAAHPTQLDPELAYPDAETLALVDGEYRTSLIIKPDNGKLPFTEAGLNARRTYVTGLDGPEQRMTTERCIGGVGWAPLQIRYASMVRQIVQTEDQFVLHTEAYNDLRIIGIDAAPRKAAMAPPGGDSIASWDGDTLVIETRNLDPQFSTHGIVTVMSPNAQITERFRYVSPDEIVYTYTVDDPAYYSQPWTGEYSLIRSKDKVYEFACHEGNYAMAGMLGGARYEERDADR